ncbi:MAG: hypothetical protein LBE12_09355 [Planctomycetaceae bacterium]|jgi:hypothetical protein|nr:hypothetical protein [Planctomycetaceae bacterium]
MEIGEAVQHAVKMLGKNEFKTSELVEQICLLAEYKESPVEQIKNRVDGYMNRNSKSKNALYAKSLNAKNRPQKGVYRIIKKKEQPIIKIDKKGTSPKIKKDKENEGNFPDFNQLPSLFSINANNKLYFGKAGEFAVISELLFNGYNASIMSVDEGIDITASKNNKFFFIQVKSTQFINDSVSLSIKHNKFINNSSAEIYFIIVFRYAYKSVNTNRYIVIQNKLLDNYIFTGAVSKKDDGTINVKIKQKDGHLYLYNGNEYAKIDHLLDNFNSIQ